MKHRFTKEELDNEESKSYMSDLELLNLIVYERKMECGKILTPLYERLHSIQTELIQLINHGKKTII